MSSNDEFDCIVVGSGHAGSCAALSAAESGCKNVLIIDKCPVEWVGGNGYFTAGAHRTVHKGLEDLLPIVTNVSPELASRIDIDAYTNEQFAADIMRLAEGRSDPALVDAVVGDSREAIDWLARSVGVPFTLSFNRQAYEVDGRQKFWGGMALSVADGGKGLIVAHQKALTQAGVKVWFGACAQELVVENGAVCGVIIEAEGLRLEIRAAGVVLAAGGFEASAELRSRYLGAGWEKARVRGTPYNTGDGFEMARRVGAKMTGDWQGCHSTAWDADAPLDAGERLLTNQFTKSGYPLGVMVNMDGLRFVDEGEDFRNYTYAKFGRAILIQPGACAFQIWDTKGVARLRKEEYGEGVVEHVIGENLEELAQKLTKKGLENSQQLIDTIHEFNNAVYKHRSENPSFKWDPSKSNWALALDEPPLVAVKVTCGITFTFGGLAIEASSAGVLSDVTGKPIEGLYCTGEMVGGLFYGNYPGGSGLTAGAVFGRKAGKSIAARCASVQ